MVLVTRTRGRLSLVLFGSILALLLAEGVLRLLPERHPRGALRQLHELRTDRAWPYGLRPGARAALKVSGDLVYEINEDGFRGPRYAMDKPRSVFRFVVLGDSLAFGYGVSESDTFVRQMETLLAAHGPARVLNFGVGGYNPYDEAALFADLGVKYRPDLVLVQFCINDLNDPTLHFDAHTRLHLGTIPAEAYPDPSVRSAGVSLVTRLLRPCRSLELCARLNDAWLGLRRDPARAALPAAASALAALALATYLPNLAPRAVHSVYFTSAYPLFLVLVAWGIGELNGRASPSGRRAALVAAQAVGCGAQIRRHAALHGPDLAELREVSAYLASVVPPGGTLVTMESTLAVEDGLRIAPGWEMDKFSYFPRHSEAEAARHHVLSQDAVRRSLRDPTVDAVVLSDHSLGVLAGRGHRGYRPYEALSEERLRALLPGLERYRLTRVIPNFGQFRDRLYVLLPADR